MSRVCCEGRGPASSCCGSCPPSSFPEPKFSRRLSAVGWIAARDPEKGSAWFVQHTGYQGVTDAYYEERARNLGSEA